MYFSIFLHCIAIYYLHEENLKTHAISVIWNSKKLKQNKTWMGYDNLNNLNERNHPLSVFFCHSFLLDKVQFFFFPCSRVPLFFIQFNVPRSFYKNNIKVFYGMSWNIVKWKSRKHWALASNRPGFEFSFDLSFLFLKRGLMIPIFQIKITIKCN